MSKLIEIPRDANILISSQVLNLDKPDCVYLTVSEKISLLKKKGDSISIGSSIANTNTYTITSPISGTITGVKEIMTINGPKASLELTNDFREKTLKEPITKRDLKKISSKDLDNILSIFNINFQNVQNLILNAIDNEPYVATNNFYLFLYYDGFLETLDTFAKIYNFKSITICVKASSSENISNLMSTLGMYPNITLEIVPDLYLIGEKKFLLSHLNMRDENTCIINSETFYNIYNLIKRNRNVSDKLLTISGNAIKNPSIVRIKLGTPLDYILKNFSNISKDSYYIANGLMSGKEINPKNFIITSEINSILIMKPKETPKPSACIKCGACINICPVNINPTLLDNPEYLKKVKDKCLKCGLCSYICPTYINFNDKLKGEDHE